MRPIPGTPFTVAVEASETDGRAVVMTATMPPGLHVDAHTHDDEEQINIVLAGRVRARIGDAMHELDAGGILLMPRGIEHELWNDGPDFAEVVEIYTPPGFEDRVAGIMAALPARA